MKKPLLLDQNSTLVILSATKDQPPALDRSDGSGNAPLTNIIPKLYFLAHQHAFAALSGSSGKWMADNE